MSALLQRVFRIQPNEGLLTLALGLLLLSNSIAQQMAGLIGYSGFVSEGGPYAILVLWIIDYLLIVVVGSLQMLYIDRINRVRTMEWLSIGFAAVFIVVRLMFAFAVPTWMPYSLMYLISDQQFMMFPAVFWILANDTVQMAQAKRIFPVIASAAFVGKLIGFAIAGFSPSILSHFKMASYEVLIVIPLLYVLIFLVTRWRFRNLAESTPKPARGKSEALTSQFKEAWDFIKSVPSFRYLAISIGVLTAASVVLEFYYTVFVKGAFADQGAFQAFHSAYRLTLTLLSFGAQTFVTNRILGRMKLENTFLILPILTVVGVVGAIVFPGLITAMFALMAYKLPRNTIDESAHKSLRSLIPEARRGRVSLFLDIALVGGASALICVITGLIVLIGPLILGDQFFYLYLVEGLGLAAVGLWSAWKARQTYEASLLNWQLTRRKKAQNLFDKLDL